MTGVVSTPRGILFRKTRTMPDGRLLIRSGQSFMIMEPDEMRRVDRWLMISVAIDMICLVAIVTAVLLSEQGAVSEDAMWSVIWATAAVLVLSAVTIGAFLLVSLGSRTQPADQSERLEEIWKRAG